MKSLLVLSPAFSFPPQSGGDIRLFELLRRLAKDFDVHLLSYGSGDSDAFVQQSGVKSVVLVPGGQPRPANSYLRQKFDLWKGAPHGLRLDIDPIFAHALTERRSAIRPRAVLIEHVYMAQYQKLLRDITVFVSCYDVETTKMRRWFDGNHAGPIVRLRRRMQLSAMRRREASLGRIAHTTFATSDLDRDELKQMSGGGRFLSVPNGADLGFFRPRPTDSFAGPPAAFFVGSLFYQPNLEAAMLLKSDIWPRVRRAIPDAVCHIAGNHGGLDLNSLNDERGGVRFHGLVPDIRTYLAMSQLMVVPLRVGSGTRIKIIESMATGTPVVSTRIGAEGIACTHEQDVLLADGVDDFADAVIRLLRDRNEARRIGDAGRRLVEARYTWDSSAAVMRDAMDAAM